MSIVLKAENISKIYGNSKVKVEALKPSNLEFIRGEFVAITGKSGSGKSTLLRLLGALERPTEGVVCLDGEYIEELSDRELSRIRRRKIGFVNQDYSLFPEFTAYENILLPIHLDGRIEEKEKIMKLMRHLGISYCKNRFPSEMSGGEQQRVAIARALAIEPAIILADEPTGNLDAENAEEVVLLLSKAAQIYNQTIVMVTHDRQMADYADRIIYIKDGVITNAW